MDLYHAENLQVTFTSLGGNWIVRDKLFSMTNPNKQSNGRKCVKMVSEAELCRFWIDVSLSLVCLSPLFLPLGVGELPLSVVRMLIGFNNETVHSLQATPPIYLFRSRFQEIIPRMKLCHWLQPTLNWMHHKRFNSALVRSSSPYLRRATEITQQRRGKTL